MNKLSSANKKKSIIQIFIIIGNFFLPIYSFILFFAFFRTALGFFLAIFISAAIIERAWETFKTTKEKKREQLHGDWTLVAVTATYLILFFLFLTEFYVLVKTINLIGLVIGIVGVALAFRLRFWGMAALGKQWAIHAVGAQKIQKVRLIKVGPYKFIRHPIYLGIIFEVLGYPLIYNARIAFLFALFVCVPLIVIRAFFEEKSSLRRFGGQYLLYRENVGMFIPVKFRLKKT